jgi:hypothetical protein
MIDTNTLDRNGDEYRHLYQTYLRKGHNGLTDVEARALSVGSANNGAALAPTSWSDYVQNVWAQDYILSKVNIVKTTTGFTQPVLLTDATGNTNVAEGALGTESYTGSNFMLSPRIGTTGTTTATFSLKKYTAWATVSNELLEDSESAQSVEELLKRQLTARLTTLLNRHILIGTGSANGQLQGSFNAAKVYSRTSVMGGTQTAISMWHIARCLMNNSGTDEPLMPWELFQNSVWVFNSYNIGNHVSTGDIPAAWAYGDENMMGRPYMYFPLDSTGAATSGSNHIHLFDPTQYMLAMNLSGMTVTRLSERYADSNQTAFVVSVRADGNILNSQAVLNINRG